MKALRPRIKKKLMGHISGKRFVSDFHHGMVHQRDANSGFQRRSRRRMGHVETSTDLGLQERLTQARSSSTRRLWIQSIIHETRSMSIASGSNKTPGYNFQSIWLGWRGQQCSISLHTGASVYKYGQDHRPVEDRNNGTRLKNQWFPLSETCTATHWQDYHGKGNFRKSYCNAVGRRFPIGIAYSYTVKKGYSYLCRWMT